MWILRVDMSNRTYRLEDVPADYANLGGRGLTSTIIHDEVPPLCHPLGPNNKLVFAPGMITGSSAPTSARVSVGTKSPLTGGIKEANAGSSWAQYLAYMQIKAMIVEGQPDERGQYWTLLMTWDADAGKPVIEFQAANDYVGQNLYDVFPKVYERYGDKVAIAGIGPAGEMSYGDSGIVFNDMSNRPSRYAGRGGVGAVMGSKGIKFIVIDRTGKPATGFGRQVPLRSGAQEDDRRPAHPRHHQAQGWPQLLWHCRAGQYLERGRWPANQELLQRAIRRCAQDRRRGDLRGQQGATGQGTVQPCL